MIVRLESCRVVVRVDAVEHSLDIKHQICVFSRTEPSVVDVSSD
jgi:hypothetical protein